MATQIVIDVSLEAQGVVENIQKIEAELNKLNAERDALLQSGLSTEALTSSLNSLDSEIAKLNGTYDKLVQSTNSYEQATQKATQAADKVTAAQAKTERQIKTAEGVTKTLAGSINIATSAFAVFGVENEAVQKSLLKVQAAAAFATGIKDLTEGTKLLNTANVALNSTLLKNPFVLVGALIAALVLSFVDFNSVIKVITETVKIAFIPLTALFNLFKEQGTELDEVTFSLSQYNKEITRLTENSEKELRVAQRNLDVAKARKASIEEITELERQLAVKASVYYGEVRAEADSALAKIDKELIEKVLDEKEVTRLQKERLDIQKQRNIADAQQFAQETKINVIKQQVEQNAIDRAKQNRDDLLEALRKQLAAEEKIIRDKAATELDVLKESRIAGDLTLEQFNTERIKKEIETNEKVTDALRKFELQNKQIQILGNKNTETILAERNQRILEVQRANTDIRLGLVKDAVQQEVVVEQDLTVTLATINREYQEKKIETTKQYNQDDVLEKEKLSLRLQELEIEKEQEILLLYDLGSKEYFELSKSIVDKKAKLEIDSAALIIAINEDLQAKLLAAVKVTVEGIGTIVQDVSPLFESVGQTALQTLADITTQVPDLLAKFQDETLTANQKLAAGLSFVGASIGQINTIVQDATEERIENINREEEERIASLERQKEAGLITEQQLASGITQIEAEAQKKRRQEQKKAFQVEKGIRIVQAVAQTAAAALNAFSSASAIPIIGPGLAPIFAGVAAAFGAAQIALIASQKFPDEGGGGGATSTPSVSAPSVQAAQGSITPTQFEPNVFGTGVSQEETFGASTTNANTGGNVLRAYVVESDIASTSQRLNTIRTTSEL